ncbi:hypothetical protein ACFQJ8_09530 [Halocatena marina]|uniref:hypothetical protein n=1 Tax=Halocatena marina TaxID=2934937 RepID=UPI00360FC323
MEETSYVLSEIHEYTEIGVAINSTAIVATNNKLIRPLPGEIENDILLVEVTDLVLQELPVTICSLI